MLDYRLGSDIAYAFLCELSDCSAVQSNRSVCSKTRRGRLFVRALRRKTDDWDKVFRINATADGGALSLGPENCHLIRGGEGWRLYSYETGDRDVDAASLRLHMLPSANFVPQRHIGGSHPATDIASRTDDGYGRAR